MSKSIIIRGSRSLVVDYKKTAKGFDKQVRFVSEKEALDLARRLKIKPVRQ